MKRKDPPTSSPDNKKRAKTERVPYSPRKNRSAQKFTTGGETAWKRPDCAGLKNVVNPTQESFYFQQVDTGYYNGNNPSLPYNQRNFRKQEPIIRLFGVTEAGHSVLVHVVGFVPYFYIDTWPNFNADQIPKFQKALEDQLRAKNQNKYDKYIRRISIVERRSLWGYSDPNSTFHFLKVETVLPIFVKHAKDIISSNLHVTGIGMIGRSHYITLRVYEANMVYALRFMIDTDIRGAGWIELPRGSYSELKKKTSHCQIELIANADDVVARNGTGRWMNIAPVRILSWDIECMSLDGGFPDAEQGDPVIQISNVVKIQGCDTPMVKNVFCLHETAPMTTCEIIWFKTEAELIKAWAKFVQKVDPDIITGYNIMNFDFPYVLTRAKKLKVEAAGSALSRLLNHKTTARKKEFQSAQAGSYGFHDISIPGRVVMDLLPIIRTGHKLRSYGLNAVASHFLKEQKDDVHYSIMSTLQKGTPSDRRRLAKYCLKDSDLVIRLMDKLLVVINNVEMARVTGVPLGFLVTRGQGIKVLSQLYRKARQQDIIIPVLERGRSDTSFQGATVLEPDTGFYTEPITTLDFASLYPSIMMAHNLCYTTWIDIRRKDQLGLTDDDITETPTGDYFVKAHKRKGLLPEILNDLLTSRKAAKKDMKAAKDPFLKAVFNGRQLALKISANSVYGFTGAQNGALPCMAISGSVTSFGRQMIDQSKEYVEKHYCIANGFETDAHVIYGDTDSVMIKFGIDDIGRSIELGNEAADLVSQIFIKPIKLEFEKVYKPYLLMSKKRYAGMLWTRPDKFDYMDCKGIETKRRDNCLWVAETLQRALDHLLIDGSVALAKKFIQEQIANLMENKVDLSELIISKQLKKIDSYANIQPHVELAKKMMKRDLGSAPVHGDRVAFVYVKVGKKARAYEKAEDPMWVLTHNLPIDTEHYIKTQLQKPLTRLFGPILQDKINTLFEGDHNYMVRKQTFNKKKKGGAMSMMAKFVKVCSKCLKCGAKIKDSEKTVCKSCKPFEGQVYLQKIRALKYKEERYQSLWTQCQHCQGSMCQEILCSNNACPLYYRRIKARKDLEDLQDTLKKFQF